MVDPGFKFFPGQCAASWAERHTLEDYWLCEPLRQKALCLQGNWRTWAPGTTPPTPHYSPSWSVRLDRKKALGAGSQTKGSVGQSDTSSSAQSPSPPLDSDLSFQDPKECLECNGARQPLGSGGQRRGCLCASKPDPSLERSLPDLQSP